MGRYLRPATLEGALALLAERMRTVLAGGTDHYPARVLHAPDEDILDISALSGLRAIERREDHWFLPCLATWSDLIAADLPAVFDGLRAAARQIGGRQVQNAATVLGNVCNASPAADGIPCLLALDAEVELAARAGRRVVPLAEFLRGPRQTARRADELALGLRIPAGGEAARSVFLKLGARRYLVISIVMVAAVAELDGVGRIARARIAVGACSPVARRLPALEAALAGQQPDPALVRPEHLAPLVADRRRARHRRLSPRGGAGTGAARGRVARRGGGAGGMRSPAEPVAFTLNGRAVRVLADPARRLADVLRDDLGLTGTKIGCNAGDCGACTVLLDGAQVCACMVPLGRVAGARCRDGRGAGGAGMRSAACRMRSCVTARRSAASARRGC